MRELPLFQTIPFNECDIRFFFLGGERSTLYKNIEKRCEAMIQMGLMEEVCELLLNKQLFYLPENTSGYKNVCPVVSASIGYRQTVNYLLQDDYQYNNIIQFSKYLREFTTATRNYAKKQFHWYRNQNSFLWLHPRKNHNFNHQENNNDKLVDSIVDELYHWITVPKEEYLSILNQQVQQSIYYQEQIKKMKKNEMRIYHDPTKKWSAEEFILRACEGNNDPHKIRTHVESYQIENHEENLRKFINIADNCRSKLEKNVDRNNDIKNFYLLHDNENEYKLINN